VVARSRRTDAVRKAGDHKGAPLHHPHVARPCCRLLRRRGPFGLAKPALSLVCWDAAARKTWMPATRAGMTLS